MDKRDIAAKADVVHEAFVERESTLIAFLGGMDSNAVAALTHEALGDSAVAYTAKNETLSDVKLNNTKRVVGEIDIEHLTVGFSEPGNPDLTANDDDRCYHCRTMRLDRIYEAARDRGIEAVCNGTNASDPSEDHRPGLRAIEELEALPPLLVHGITKEEVHAIANDCDLSVADKPSAACLSSRIPTGLRVAEERLSWVEHVGTIFRAWDSEQFRARDHDSLARIEVAPKELDCALDVDFVHAARDHLRDAGFDHIISNLHGYRTGSVGPGAEAETDADVGDGDLLVDGVLA